MRCRMGNPKKKSRFICLKCLRINEVGDGIQRTNQREKLHIKDLHCIFCGCTTKNIEVRHCDWIEEIKDKAEKLHSEYYGKVG